MPAPCVTMQEFIAIRTRDALKLLRTVNVNKATGGDRIGNRILEELSPVIALPIALLCPRILYEGKWPKAWQEHLLFSLFSMLMSS